MKEKYIFNFLIGLLIGALVALIVWYWQKSTRAEDGALALLDRLKDAERKAREMGEGRVRGETATSTALSAGVFLSADDLQQVKGVGPVFAERLQSAGIATFAHLAALTAEKLAGILDIQEGRAGNILAEAKQFA